MHPYQIDDEVKNSFLIVAVLLAVGLAYLFDLILSKFHILIPWWVESPSILGFYGLIYWLYDKFLWKIKLFQRIDWLYVPNLAGAWDVKVKTSFDGFAQIISGKAIFRQTASKVSISLETDTSESHSIHAALIRVDKLRAYELTYNYVNHPKADSTQTMSIHLGTTHVAISDDCKKMDGEYYAGRDRQNYGRISFSRSRV
jgi:hypothetical protein